MILDNFDITWSKGFKGYAFYSLCDSRMAENAAEWLFELYHCHESMYEESWFPMDNPIETQINTYNRQVETLINQSKELKMIRKFFDYMSDIQGVDYMKEFRKAMKESYELVIE